MNILMTGGTGFIGSALTKELVNQGHSVTVLSRNLDKVAKLCGPGVQALGSLSLINANDRYQAIVNLAGAPIVGARWSQARKQEIRDSRIGLTEQLITCIARMEIKPELLISGSAIGYYGNQGDTVLSEQATPYEDFSQQLCADWEAAAKQAEQFGVRVCLIRTGLVIAGGGGFLQQMLLPFRLGLGGRLGDGRQWMSWIHRQDWIHIALTMMADATMHGAYNATAPNPVTNAEFTRLLAQCLNRPALLPVPALVLKMMLGEMSQLLLGSQRVVPERLLAQGFKFHYDDLAAALHEALS
ncbi:MAG: TIGR01777 family oxidoreductase [Methylobacter sp.]|nr:TIGR01777 family oxidoreductase [Methylobacter sp.]MDP2099492.1 TIGR01777 family oxidoreductase [Methylobacter sp.]MDP2429732.1 TIGR01777 family oxidoreductase [Methylobacter sp.]MDP3054346.1 TIGR01777 family oxidoreductase [Methylobacter sp.]MDP3361006.1 TIGR01777 family oxidoreductase [Methylobacter sp.]